MHHQPTCVTAVSAAPGHDGPPTPIVRALRTLTESLLIALVVMGLGCEDEASSTRADGDVTRVDPSDVVAIDGAVKPDAPPPLPDLPIVDECVTHGDCDDELFCNGVETCNPTAIGAGQNGCLSGEAPVMTDEDPRDCEIPATCDEETDSFPSRSLEAGDACDDAIACTSDDVCTNEGVCTGVRRNDLCSDGLFCNGVESCNSDIGCVPGASPVGSDPAAGDCLVPGPCEESTNSFPLIPAPLDTPCDDAVACTKSDGCTSSGSCAGTTIDAACSDGDFCNGKEVCTAAGCVAGSDAPPEDPTPNDCETWGTCDEETDSWTVVPRPVDSPCDDGIACTTSDFCQNLDGTLSCTGTEDATLCHNGAFCDGQELCTSKGCISGTPPEAPGDEPTNGCTAWGSCDDELGAFSVVNKPNGTPCDDGASCTSVDLCNSEGSCSGTPDHAACDDTIYCNGVEVCSSEGCGSGPPPPPPEDTDPNDCVGPGNCNEQSKSYPLVPKPGTPCSDGADCTLDDACDSQGSCVGAPDHDACDDGAFCNGEEQCTSGGCTDGVAPTPPADANTADCLVPGPCEEATKTFPTVTATAGTSCNDGVDCTVDDICSGLTCSGTPSDAKCADDDACDGAERCTVTGCEEGTPLTAPIDPNPNDCQARAACDPVTGEFALVSAELGSPCDDAVDCTTDDACEEGDGGVVSCRGVVDDSLCDDQAFCNGEETCSAAGCSSGTPPSPPEDLNGFDCLTIDPVCDPVSNSFPVKPVAAGTTCIDDDDCTSVTTCNADGACVGAPDNSICDDGNPCNGAETCVDSGCVMGVPPIPSDPNPNDCLVPNVCDPVTGNYSLGPAPTGSSCDDGLQCTTNDRCDAAGACTLNTPSNAACADGAYCNGDETCDGLLGCRPGAPRAPPIDPDPSDCTGPLACNEATDSFPIGALGNGAACDDGVTCTMNDVCSSDQCGGTPSSALCDDGLFCNGEETCSAAGCSNGTPPSPPEDLNGVDCLTIDPVCDPVSNSFPVKPVAAGTSCIDDDGCTSVTTCNADGACVGAPDNSICDDGDPCNGAETCVDSACVMGVPPIPSDPSPNDCLVPHVCDPVTGEYSLGPASTGSSCDDGLACTTNDRCDAAGACTLNTPSNAACADGAYCNGDETCDGLLGCRPGAPRAPPVDPNPSDCTGPLACNEATDSFPIGALGNGAACDDGVSCTTNDVCSGGQCGGSPSSALCNDGLFCNGEETCDGEGCVMGVVPSAPTDDDPTDCLVAGACDDAFGGFQLVPAALLAPCDDGVACTVGDQCNAGGTCLGSPENVFCADDSVCNGEETCSLVGCLNGTPLAPGAGELPQCMRPSDECSEVEGGFPLVPDVGASCNDDVDCTTSDMCDSSAVCVGMPDDEACADANLCNGTETCGLGGCSLGTPLTPPIDSSPLDCIEVGPCDSSTGEFEFLQKGDGNACVTSDGVNGVCFGGGCSSMD